MRYPLCLTPKKYRKEHMPPYPTQKGETGLLCSGNNVFFALLGELFFFFFFWVTRVFLVGLSPFLSPAKKDKFVSNLFEGMWETYERPPLFLLLLRPQFRARRRGFAITRVKEGGATYLVKETGRYQVTYYRCFFNVCTVIIRIISFFSPRVGNRVCVVCTSSAKEVSEGRGHRVGGGGGGIILLSLFLLSPGIWASICLSHPPSPLPPPPPPFPVGPRLKFDKMLTISRTS